MIKEVSWAIKRGLVVCEFTDREAVETGGVRAHASAYVHTALLTKRVEYIPYCALTMKMFDRASAERIGESWNLSRDDHDMSFERKDMFYEQRETIFWFKCSANTIGFSSA